MKHAHKIVVRKLKESSPFGRPKHIWENNTKRDLKGTGCKDGDWIHLA
jgi:hypothetical protein